MGRCVIFDYFGPVRACFLTDTKRSQQNVADFSRVLVRKEAERGNSPLTEVNVAADQIGSYTMFVFTYGYPYDHKPCRKGEKTKLEPWIGEFGRGTAKRPSHSTTRPGRY